MNAFLHLVLPHQLFEVNFKAPHGTVFVFIEHDLMFRQYAFHAQKLVLHRASMAAHAAALTAAGFEVITLASSASDPSAAQLSRIMQQRNPERVTWFDVVDDWLERDLIAALAAGGYAVRPGDELETPNFITSREEIDEWFARPNPRMHDFYVWQRRKLGILLDSDGKPTGGQWSFDAENRKKLPKGYVPPTVARPALHADPHVAAAIAWVEAEFPDAPGNAREFAWPITHEAARAELAMFIRERLHNFGPYEDAISTQHPFIHHSLLTPPLNIGLLNPTEIVHATLAETSHSAPLASVEGFIRQVIGWREYMRATYRTHGRTMRTQNHLDHTNALGAGWWHANTGLAPVDLVISRALRTGYAHHIERLMVLGNVMSLLRIDPDDVYRWFMEMFIDAYDWVMVPNVYAMSQFAAGATITTKPYVSGSNYLRKMSDLPTGEWVPDWDALYWAFIGHHREVFAANPRARMIVSLHDKIEPGKLAAHEARAQALLTHPASRLVGHVTKEATHE